jgi:hypothetical protein
MSSAYGTHLGAPPTRAVFRTRRQCMSVSAGRLEVSAGEADARKVGEGHGEFAGQSCTPSCRSQARLAANPISQHSARWRTDRRIHCCLGCVRHPGRFVDFLVVKPYEAAKEHFSAPAEETTPADIALLTEIRDLLTRRGDPV